MVAILATLFSGRIAATPATEHLLRDIDGVLHGALEKPAGWKWTLLFFLMTDCPVANQYVFDFFISKDLL